MSASNEADPNRIVISSDEDSDGSVREICDDRKGTVVLAILPSEKRVFTPTKKYSCPTSDSDSEVEER